MTHSVYILRSEKINRFYTGETTDFEVRQLFHENALSEKFTAKAKDWVLFLLIGCRCKEQALKIESHIKRMKSAVYIRNLRKYPEIVDRLMEKYPY